LSQIEKLNIKINFDKINVQKDLENIAQRKIEYEDIIKNNKSKLEQLQKQLDTEKHLFSQIEKQKQEITSSLDIVVSKKDYLLKKQSKFKQFFSIDERNSYIKGEIQEIKTKMQQLEQNIKSNKKEINNTNSDLEKNKQTFQDNFKKIQQNE